MFGIKPFSYPCECTRCFPQNSLQPQKREEGLHCIQKLGKCGEGCDGDMSGARPGWHLPSRWQRWHQGATPGLPLLHLHCEGSRLLYNMPWVGRQGWTECPVVVEPHAVTSTVPCSPRCHLSTGSGLKTGPGHQHFIARLMERSDIHWQRNYLNKQPNLFCIISPTSFFVSFSSLYYFPLAGGYNLSAVSKPSSIIRLSGPG